MWPSDFIYEGLHETILGLSHNSILSVISEILQDYFMISGQVNLQQDTGSLDSYFTFSSDALSPPPGDGLYKYVFKIITIAFYLKFLLLLLFWINVMLIVMALTKPVYLI